MSATLASFLGVVGVLEFKSSGAAHRAQEDWTVDSNALRDTPRTRLAMKNTGITWAEARAEPREKAVQRSSSSRTSSVNVHFVMLPRKQL